MDDPAPIFTRHKLDVDDYYRMSDAGIIHPEARTELIGGDIIDMPSMGPDHAFVVEELGRQLAAACSGVARLRCQLPISIDRFNEPQPDFAVCRAVSGRSRGHPRPEDVLLLIEVADTSLRFDRTIKLPLYSRANIPEVWIVDLRNRVIDICRAPADGAYTIAETHGPGGRLAPASDPAIEIDLATIFK